MSTQQCSKKITVRNVSEAASEKQVKDFFLFCGKIKEFELIKEESSNKQIAHITFERETAAKTAKMLTNAVIGDSQITVEGTDDDSHEEEEFPEGDGITQEDKVRCDKKNVQPKARVLAEIIAAGYKLQDAIIEQGLAFDAKYGISARFSSYLKSIQEQLQSLDEKYNVSGTVVNTATQLNEKYQVQGKVDTVVSQVQDTAKQALDTTPGKQLAGLYCSAYKQVADVYNDAVRIANEQKAKQIVENSSQVKAESQ
ncbi:34887_t:CDS:2 [Racocetra persica]|uniref:34887_t:CDS:1 n=1 Tax=Racocetra persica TaxID=160502 RepID=A0ACA9KC81_9GLOM|nr:34887_t:CDS:2 [Racocetra persica]